LIETPGKWESASATRSRVCRREDADASARQGEIDRQRDDDGRLAPAPTTHQADAALALDELERLEL
jgi:hypothetical protein